MQKIDVNGVHALVDKVETIRQAPTPKDVTESARSGVHGKSLHSATPPQPVVARETTLAMDLQRMKALFSKPRSSSALPLYCSTMIQTLGTCPSGLCSPLSGKDVPGGCRGTVKVAGSCGNVYHHSFSDSNSVNEDVFSQWIT